MRPAALRFLRPSSRRWWTLGLPVAHLFLAARLSAQLADPAGQVDYISDSDVAYLCRIVYRDPHCPARAAVPDTCPVHSGE